MHKAIDMAQVSWYDTPGSREPGIALPEKGVAGEDDRPIGHHDSGNQHGAGNHRSSSAMSGLSD
jgi:hypothetical protein